MGTNLIGGAGAMPASSSLDEALVLEADDFFTAPSAFVAAARELVAPAADAAARKLEAPAADVAALRTLACPAIGFFRSVPFPRADDTLLSDALAFEVSIFNGAAFLGAPPRGDAARAGGAFRGDAARGTPDVPSALGDMLTVHGIWLLRKTMEGSKFNKARSKSTELKSPPGPVFFWTMFTVSVL